MDDNSIIDYMMLEQQKEIRNNSAYWIGYDLFDENGKHISIPTIIMGVVFAFGGTVILVLGLTELLKMILGLPR